MKLIDRVISTIAPQWALNREVARVKLGWVDHNRRALQASYDAAERSRTTADWSSRKRSADQAIVPDLGTINARSRIHGQNDWMTRSVIDGYRRHVVGTGIRCYADARDENGEPLTEFNEKANRLFWEQWARHPKRCDIEHRKTFTEMQGLLVEEFVSVGGSILIWSYERKTDHVGLKLQLIEPEQLAVDMYIAPNSNEVRHGIEIGKYGEPLAYWIYTTGHPLESFNVTKPERVPADRVLHFMRQNRVRQTHPVSRLAAVLKKMRNAAMYDDYTQVRARLEACIGAVITTDIDGMSTPSDLGLNTGSTGGGSETDGNGNEQWTFEPGMNPELPPGKSVTFHQPTTPGTTYEPFMLAQLHGIAAGSGLDFNTVAKDYRQGSFISQRMGTLERDREIDPLQNLLIDTVLRPTREMFITIAVLEGRLDAPGFFEDIDIRERYLRASWRPPPKPPINEAQFYAAMKIATEQRLLDRASIIERATGRPYREVFDQIDDEQEYAESLKIGLPDAPPERGGTGTKTSASEPRPTRDPNPPAPSGRRSPHSNGTHRARIRDVIAAACGSEEMADDILEMEEGSQ